MGTFISDIGMIKLKNNMKYVDLIKQLQKYTDDILCLINGIELKIYNYNNIPNNIIFDRSDDNIFYFKSIDYPEKIYYIFGIKNAEFITENINNNNKKNNKNEENTFPIPSILYKDYEKNNFSEKNPIIQPIDNICNNLNNTKDNIVIIENGEKMLFPFFDLPILINYHE